MATSNGIVTPEAVVLDIETAGVASRLLAGLIDMALSLVVVVVVTIFGGVLRFGDDSTLQVMAAVAWFFALLVVPTVEQMLFRGRTFGKMAVGIRAVTLDGAPIRFRHAVLRSMGGLVDRLVPPGGITGLLFVLGTERAQTIGDLIAGTVVVRDPERHLPTAAVWFPVPAGYEAFAATIDPTAMTNEQYTVVRAFLLRSRMLGQEPRRHLGNELVQHVSRAVGVDVGGRIAPETFLLCVMARFQRRNFPAYQPAAWTGSPPPVRR